MAVEAARAVRLLHLSDLHCTRGRSNDRAIVLRALVSDVAQTAGSDNLDFVVFSGDMASSGAQSEYEAAFEDLVVPLLEALHLDTDRFFLCPGNHDVNRARLNSVVAGGLRSLSDRDEVNQAIDGFGDGTVSVAGLGLGEFEEFRNSVSARPSGPSLCATYRFSCRGSAVSVACLNTAWRAGKDVLPLLGERQLDCALAECTGVDICIAVMHHPAEALHDFLVVKHLLRGFHVICTGHHHLDDAQMISRSDGSATVFSAASCLYRSRTDPIGYSIIEIDHGSGRVELVRRVYSDRFRRFECAAGTSSVFEITLSRTGLQPLFTYDQRSAAEGPINGRLLPTVANSTLAPRSLRDIFVEPLLFEDTEYRQDPARRAIPLKTILEGSDDILFIGNRETGKTTLLDYVCLWHLDEAPGIVPARIAFSAIKEEGRNKVFRTISDYLSSLGILPTNLDDLCTRGAVIALIDDIDFAASKRVEAIQEFALQYPACRLMMTASDNPMSGMFETHTPEIARRPKMVYLHSLRARQIRALVQKWFGKSEVDLREVSRSAVENLFRARLPRTPFMVSVVLWILEKHREPRALNRATLMEQFTMLLLERLRADEALSATFDFRHKEAFLEHLAELMSRNNQFTLTPDEYDALAHHYFRDKGFEAPESFLDLSFAGGILCQARDLVYFRYRCFEEFYCAKAMLRRPEFLDYVTGEQRYLRFDAEIDLYSGLLRDCSLLLDQLGGRVDALVSALPTASLSMLDDMEAKDVAAAVLDDVGLQGFQVSDEQHDAILDATEEIGEEQTEPKKEPTEVESQCFGALYLYGHVLRNCEMLTRAEKYGALERCIQGFLVLLAGFEQDASVQASRLKEPARSEAQYFCRVVVPVLMQMIITDSLGTPKLDSQFRRLAQSTPSLFIQFVLVCVLGDMRLAKYFYEFEEFIGRTGREKKSLLSMTFLKLLAYYTQRHYDRADRERLESLIADVYLKIKDLPKRAKTEVLSRLRRQYKPASAD